MSFRVRKSVDAIRLFKINRQCFFDASLTDLAYRRFADIDWKDDGWLGWFPHTRKTGGISGIPKRQASAKNRDRKDVLLTETTSQIDVTYDSSRRMTMNHSQ